jgi:hypothetical protein
LALRTVSAIGSLFFFTNSHKTKSLIQLIKNQCAASP